MKTKQKELLLSNGWSKSTLLTVAANEIYAFDDNSGSFYKIDTSKTIRRRMSIGGPDYKFSAMVGHGTHLYVIDNNRINAFATVPDVTHVADYDVPLDDIDSKSLHLMSAGSSLCLQVNTPKSMKLFLVKPLWYTPPGKSIVSHSYT